jgi:glyoxylase-like metal-dependent hydrolase (beta-lactamase superfamily II)
MSVLALAEPPPFGEVRELEPGILWVRAPLPFALDHVNLWLIDDGDAWTAIDTGYGDAATRAIWEGLFRRELRGKPLSRVLVTHFHPDHLGQAGWLCAVTDAPLSMSRSEWLTGRMLAQDDSESFLDVGDRHWRRAAMDEAAIARQRARGNGYRRGVTPPPGAFTRLSADDEIVLGGSTWRLIVGEGHAPEQVTLFSAERGLLLAADQILPRISPVIGVWSSQPEADPLGEFLRSLERYRGLPEDVRVLPSHHFPFTGLHARLDQLAEHHTQRLDRALGACLQPVTVAEVVQALFPRALDSHQEGFALAETLAHLNHLWHACAVQRWTEADGTWRFRRSG